MLNSISISNFKAIKDKQINKDEFDNLKESDKEEKEGKLYYQKRPLILDNLAKVNYLVGQNGFSKTNFGKNIQLFTWNFN